MTHSSVNTMLKNRRYIGELSFRDIVVPDAIPAIVPKDLFDRVQKRMDKNKQDGGALPRQVLYWAFIDHAPFLGCTKICTDFK